MGRAREDGETRRPAAGPGFLPVAPPESSRVASWEYERERYRRRNEVECLFRRLRGFRRIFPRFDRPEVMFPGFVVLALVIDALRRVNKPQFGFDRQAYHVASFCLFW